VTLALVRAEHDGSAAYVVDRQQYPAAMRAKSPTPGFCVSSHDSNAAGEGRAATRYRSSVPRVSSDHGTGGRDVRPSSRRTHWS
jgi:hypothetical protein